MGNGNASTPENPTNNIFSIVIVVAGIFIGPFEYYDDARDYAAKYVSSLEWSILDTNYLAEPLRSEILENITVKP